MSVLGYCEARNLTYCKCEVCGHEYVLEETYKGNCSECSWRDFCNRNLRNKKILSDIFSV